MAKKPEQETQPGERNLGETLVELGISLALLRSSDLYVTVIGAGLFMHSIFGPPVKELIAENKKKRSR
jgi:hypothetical protein